MGNIMRHPDFCCESLRGCHQHITTRGEEITEEDVLSGLDMLSWRGLQYTQVAMLKEIAYDCLNLWRRLRTGGLHLIITRLRIVSIIKTAREARRE